jgi:hypothetical protein
MPDHVPRVVVAYMAGIKAALAIAIGGTGTAFLVSLFNRWKRIHSAGEGLSV